MFRRVALATLMVVFSADLSRAATFHETGSIQEFTVPSTGYYRIVSWGATGGGGGYGPFGGLGAEVSGIFLLSGGDQLSVVVGGPGTAVPDYGAGGGGASWVYDAALLEVAGGGGGYPFFNPDPPEVDGRGFGGSGQGGGAGAGQGGGGGGGGWLSDGGSGPQPLFAPSGTGGEGRPAFAGGDALLYFGFDGCGPDQDQPCTDVVTTGGYGGGGGAGYNGGGGGGGYSGGDGGADEVTGGLGGTSYIALGAQGASGLPGVSSLGEVTIDAVPEPASWTLMLLGVGLLGGAARARRAQTPLIA